MQSIGIAPTHKFMLPVVGAGEALLAGFRPRGYSQLVGGKTMAAAGCVPILHMRHFQKYKALSAELVGDINTRHA